eukprot:12422156-Ditylum_brightwellii.AAC.1
MACTTSEPCGHYFEHCRTKKREFTCSDFVSYVEGLEIALQQMVEHEFCSGGGKGYVGSFCSFFKGFAQTTKETGNTISGSPGYVNEEDEWRIYVDYSHPVAPQIKN